MYSQQYQACCPASPGAVPPLGTLPPQASLQSVTVSTGTVPVWTNTAPSSSTAPTASIHLPVNSLMTPQYQFPITTNLLNSSLLPSLSTPGMILSPAADPIPRALVQRIQSGQFVDMRDMLADNISLLNQLSSLQGTVALPFNTINRTRLREIPSLVSWLYCFNAYVAVRTPDPLTQQMLAYSRLIIREALRHGGPGWLEYDRVFRRQQSINPALAWNALEPSLQAATILGQRTSGTFCTLCQESDHVASQCALAPLQQQLQTSHVSTTVSQPPSTSRPPKRPETILRICVAWNKGQCTKPRCTFRHVCATCQNAHKARDCADTPPDSEYKAGFSATPKTRT